jgi:hypothetical protein
MCIMIDMDLTVGVVRHHPQLAKLHRDYKPHHTAAKEPMSLCWAETAIRHITESQRNRSEADQRRLTVAWTVSYPLTFRLHD